MINETGFATNDDWGRYCRKLIDHVSAADPDGERFRYPRDLEGVPFEYTRVELEGLIKAHYHVVSYCEASVSMLHETTEYIAF
jgi:hypothetical protein